MNILDTLLINPLVNILVTFYQVLSFLHIPYALGFAIILLTVFVKLLLYPLTKSQLKISKKMQELAPHVSKIKEKHKGDLKSQQAATMALYQEHKVNPAAGCLPGLAQIVILVFGLYPTLMKILTLKSQETLSYVNHIAYFPFLQLHQAWDTHFFGFLLGKKPSELFATVGVVVFLIPILTGGLQFIQSKMMMPADQPKTTGPKKQDDFATMFQKQSLYLIPVMVGFFSYQFSLGLSLYWNTFTIFGIIQQYRVSGWGDFGNLLKKLRPTK